MERKLFTALQGDYASKLNDALSKQGFRRSQNVLYRPSCAECSSCLSARIRVADFLPSRSQKRCNRRNGHLIRKANSPWATEDQFDLFRRYLANRHRHGGMADMDIFEFAAMIEETPIRSRVVEYHGLDGKPDTSDLKAVCLTDVLDDGLSMVYSFFDTGPNEDSLGTYVILDHIRIAQEASLPYIYLGYWVPGSPKMDYKSRFSGLEVYFRGEWTRMEDKSAFSSATHPLSTDPIAEQVASISLPDGHPTKADQQS